MYIDDKGHLQIKNDMLFEPLIRFSFVGAIDGNYGFMYNLGKKIKEESYKTKYSQSNFIFNQQILFNDLGVNNYEYGDDINLTVSIDTNKLTQSYYVNGEKISSGEISSKMWSDFSNDCSDKITKYFLGRAGYSNCWHYGNFELYTVALYNRGLNEEEIMENTNSMIAYHNLLVENN